MTEYVNCPLCNGTGRFIELDKKPNIVKAARYTDCLACGGLGKVDIGYEEEKKP